MSTWVIVERPITGLYAGHLSEARRALAAQGRPSVDEETLARSLWAARALPVALDALADTRAGSRLAGLRVEGLHVHRIPDGGAPVEAPLIAVALHEAGSARVEVRFVPPDSAEGGEAGRDHSAAVIELLLGWPDDDDTLPEGETPQVRVSRFALGGAKGDAR